jgi:regulator of RNase E activity RraA
VKIIRMGFPVYYAGIGPLDSKGRGIVKAFDVPVTCGEASVHPGELLFADFDGIVVVPREVEQEVLRLAVEKAGKEDRARQDLRNGKTIRETYETYKIL